MGDVQRGPSWNLRQLQLRAPVGHPRHERQTIEVDIWGSSATSNHTGNLRPVDENRDQWWFCAACGMTADSLERMGNRRNSVALKGTERLTELEAGAAVGLIEALPWAEARSIRPLCLAPGNVEAAWLR